MINNKNWFTLSEALKEYPELGKDPKYSEYGFAGESIFEMIAKHFKDKQGLIIERNNRENKFVVDFRIKDPETNKIICYCDIEGDHTNAFEDDGTFKWWNLTVPIEKKKYFYRDKPFFYVKFSSDFKWCYVLDGTNVRELFTEKTILRHNGTIPRRLLEAQSCKIFNKKNPCGIHRCPIQDWVKAITYFTKKRNNQKTLW